jgi:DNA repair exonuclease SbcCD ATPase subunit
MYISYIRLKNFRGIFDGIGKKEIEINFLSPKKLESTIIGIMGGNGRGKSTLLTSIHPYPYSYDKRDSSLILDGEIGEKEIRIVSGKTRYKIFHHYDRSKKKPSNKSFIEKDGIELNENGGIGTFEAIIEQEFGLTKDYILVGRLSESTKNFVELEPAARKNFIINQLPETEPYIRAFKVVSEKCLMREKEIKYLSSEIEKYEEKSFYEEKIEDLKKRLEKSNKKIRSKEKELGKLEEKRNSILSDPKVKKVKEVSVERDDKETELADVKKTLKILLEKTPEVNDSSIKKLPKIIENLYKEIAVKSSEIENCKENHAKLSDELDELQNKLSSNKKLLSNSKSPENSLESLEKRKNELSNTLKENLDSLENLIEDDYIRKKLDEGGFTFREFSLITDLAADFNSVFNSSKLFSSSEENFDSWKKKLTSYDFSLPVAKIKKRIESWKENCSATEEKISELKRDIIRYEAKLEYEKDLDIRPINCKIDDCGFLRKGFEAKNAKKAINELKEQLDHHQKFLSRQSESLMIDTVVLNFHRFVKDSEKEYPFVLNLFSLLLFKRETLSVDIISDFFIINYGNIKINVPNIKEISDYLENSEECKVTRDKLNNLKERINDIKKNSKNLEFLEKTIKDNEDTISKKLKEKTTLVKQLDELREEEKTLIEEYNSKKKLSDKRETFVTLSEKEKELQIYIKEIDKQISSSLSSLKELNEIETLEVSLKEEISEIEGEIKDLEKELDGFSNKLSKLTEYWNRLNEFQEKYALEKAIKETVDPKKGQPLILLQTFLNSLELKVNQMLQVAFGSSFSLRFKISESEFSIPIEKEDGFEAPDILYLSEGERAMVKLIISLALVSPFVRKFQCICLDEVDAVLSNKNRKNFVEILQSQLDYLKIKQCFVISHNEEFQSDNIPVVLFPENTYCGDNIIWGLK